MAETGAILLARTRLTAKSLRFRLAIEGQHTTAESKHVTKSSPFEAAGSAARYLGGTWCVVAFRPVLRQQSRLYTGKLYVLLPNIRVGTDTDELAVSRGFDY